jgi:hypothetical protein
MNPIRYVPTEQQHGLQCAGHALRNSLSALGIHHSITVEDFENVHSQSIEAALHKFLPPNQTSIFVVESRDLLVERTSYGKIATENGESPFQVFTQGGDVALIINTSTLLEHEQSTINNTFHWVCFVLKHVGSNVTVDIMDSSHTDQGKHILISTAEMLRDNLMYIERKQRQRTIDTQIPNTSDLQRPLKRSKKTCSAKCDMDCPGDQYLD